MSGISLTDAKALAFHTILSELKESGLHKASPTFFVIYAHDNDSLGLGAHQNVVEDYISWFKKILFNVFSDKSPHGYGPIHETTRNDAHSNIITNQLCLLPKRWNEHNVDYVLVFYTKLLAQYMKDERAYSTTVDGQPPQTFFRAIFETCAEYDNQGPGSYEKACKAICSLQDAYRKAMGNKFHHVLTELALLRFRNRNQVPCYTIPILLGEDVENWEADHQWKASYLEMAETVIRVPVSPEDPYRSFFKILSRFETLERDWPLIDNSLSCFKILVAAHNPDMTATDFQKLLEKKIIEVLQNVRKGQVYQRKKPITVGSIRDILDVYARDYATLKRVSGDNLPRGLEDIDLEISQGAELLDPEPLDQENKETKEDGYKTKPEPEKVPLHGLFNKRKMGDKDIEPYRVFIRGKPGVGKSTLCRRIMYEYSWHDKLRAKFNLIVLIPVRKLDKNLTDILYMEYFRTIENGHNVAEFLQDLIWKPEDVTKPPKILVILDGLDEARGWEPHQSGLLDRLLRLPAVLVTSRNNDYAGDHTFDLRVDAVGLSMESVHAFLDSRDIVSSGTARDIKHLISVNSAVQEIVRAPIYLDIVCSGWGEGSDANHGKQPTMTALYQGVIHSLWRKDIPRLHKLDHGELVTDEIIQAVQDASRLERAVEVEIMALENIAITMMERNQLEFTGHHISTVVRGMELVQGRMPLSLEKNLVMLSVIRSSSSQYCFVHPTFQEFFAAKYIARDPDRIKKYMKSHKYHPRFDLLWRFVAGLISDSANLLSFFTILGQEPLDLLGPTHQRMVMYCLNEIDPKPRFLIQLELLSSLQMWILYDCRANNQSHMLAEAEIPMSLLHSVLVRKYDTYRDPTLQILNSLASSRAHFSTKVAETLLWPLNRGPDLRSAAAVALGSQVNLPDTVVLGLVANLGRFYWGVRYHAAQALAHQTSLSDQAVAAIICLLEGKDRVDVARAIENRPGFPDEVVAAANRVLLENAPRPTKLSAEAAFDELLDHIKELELNRGPYYLGTQVQRNLPDQAILSLLDLLKCGNGLFRDFAADALRRQESLPDEAILALMGLISHAHWDVRTQAARILSKRNYGSDRVVSDQTVSAAIELLKHDTEAIQESAYQILRSCSTNLAEASLVALVGLLGNEGGGASKAASVLTTRANLPDRVVEALVESIRPEGSAQNKLCAEVLGQQKHLPGPALSALEGLLGDSALPVRAAAVVALIRCQANLQGPVSSAIDDLRNAHGHFFGRDFVKSLRDYANPLSGQVVAALESLIDVNDFFVQQLALEILQQYKVSDPAISVLIGLLSNESVLIRIASAKVLEHQSLQGLHRAALAQLLRHESDGYGIYRPGHKPEFQLTPSHIMGHREVFMDRLPGYIGLSPGPESETAGEAPAASTVCDIENIDSWYVVWLLRSFKERYVLYLEDDAGPKGDRPPRLCLSQPSGIRTACFKDTRDYKRFLDAVRRGRQRWGVPDVVKGEQKHEQRLSKIRWLGHG